MEPSAPCLCSGDEGPRMVSPSTHAHGTVLNSEVCGRLRCLLPGCRGAYVRVTAVENWAQDARNRSAVIFSFL